MSRTWPGGSVEPGRHPAAFTIATPWLTCPPDPFPNFDSCNGNNGTDVAQNCEATTNVP